MSSEEKGVPDASQMEQELSLEEVEKFAQNFSVAFEKENVEEFSYGQSKKELLEKLKENIIGALDFASGCIQSKDGILTDIGKTEQPDSTGSSPIADTSANTRSQNPTLSDEEVDRILYQSFSGADYEGKSVLDMFNFSEREKQRLKEWNYIQAQFLKALSGGNPVFVDRTLREVDPNAFDSTNHNRTALILASTAGNYSAVTMLVQCGARPNDTDLFGRTALMEAANAGHYEVVEFLAKNGSDVIMEDKNGDTALSLASREGHLEVAGFLKLIMPEKTLVVQREAAMSSENILDKENPMTRHYSEGYAGSPEEQPDVVPHSADDSSEPVSEDYNSSMGSFPTSPDCIVPGVPAPDSSASSCDSAEQVVPDITRRKFKE